MAGCLHRSRAVVHLWTAESPAAEQSRAGKTAPLQFQSLRGQRQISENTSGLLWTPAEIEAKLLCLPGLVLCCSQTLGNPWGLAHPGSMFWLNALLLQLSHFPATMSARMLGSQPGARLSRVPLLYSLRKGKETPSWPHLSIPRRFVCWPVSPLWQ